MSVSSPVQQTPSRNPGTKIPNVRTKKGLSYVIGNTSNKDNHILPINAIQYSSQTNQLFTAGRDGTVKVWEHGTASTTTTTTTTNNNGGIPVEFSTSYSSSDDNGEDVEYQDLDERLLRLETAISSHPLPYNSHSLSTTFSIVNSFNHHFDWINDIKLINHDQNLVSCSADLSIKIIDLNCESHNTHAYHLSNNSSSIHKFPNVHTDYIKKLSYSDNQSNHIISGGLDGRVVIWDLTQYTPIQHFENTAIGNLPSSIYSLANDNAHIITTGGPNNTINVFDPRLQNPFIRKLIGHQDNIRCLLMNDHFILSGSSDTTIKLWDLRTFKVYKNFDIHEYPVWAMAVDPTASGFSRFYSGDKGGNIIKTDLSCLSTHIKPDEIFNYDMFSSSEQALLDEKLGVSTVVAKSDTPILSLCAETKESTLFSSNYESLNRYVDPNTSQLSQYQYMRSYIDYSINRENQLKDELASGLVSDNATVHTGQGPQSDDLNSDFYDLISHLSMDTTEIQSTFSHHNHFADSASSSGPGTPLLARHDNNGDDDEDGQDGNKDEEYNSMFLNVNGGPSREFINAFKEEFEFDGMNIHTVSTAQTNEFVDVTPVEILLNPVGSDQITLVPFNIKPLAQVCLHPKSVVSKRVFDNKRHLMVCYANGDLKIWDLLVCKELHYFPGKKNDVMLSHKELEDRVKEMDEIFQKYQTNDTLNNWCEVEIKAGKILVTLMESSFMNAEIYYDELCSEYPYLEVSHPDQAKRFKEVRKVKVASDDRFQIASILLNSFFYGFAIYEWKFDVLLREELRTAHKTNGSTDSDTGSITGSLRLLKKLGRISSKSNLATVSRSGTPTASANVSVSDLNVNPNYPMNEFIEGNHKSHSEFDTSLMKLLQTNRRLYSDRLNAPTYNNKKLETVMGVNKIHPAVDEEDSKGEVQYHPVINSKRFPSDLLLIIFEHSPELGNYRDLFSFSFCDVDKLSRDDESLDTQFIKDLRFYLPRWLAQPIIYNKYPVKEAPKVAFTLVEFDYSKLPPTVKIGGKSQKKIKKLPAIEGSNKLTSHNMLRVSKILGYLVEKFDSKTSEMKEKDKRDDNAKYAWDWLVLECKGQQLPYNMTLQTIKTKIWKSSSDVELRYRRKFDV
ncbi:uncharacterized protein SPAPADRAFT_55963 [Spathaspora passalidarum NRRL Y-27907]|uniref:TEP-1 C-terminal beta-propeller domain-containing protein n=1 Tax=Spathaspora passalidarum (strain NRRL Y-27907 / 11-Y1) TaxID=619300 RepID=G3ANL0_SPAPN|nr:uncharacterized protein SPAPADRAFT_55963 [Spathaspora passalidarum NRRL Y-27907]EGW32539.1 hypothetical protein SPAPADRAFT_55963 [Spathaspora passalidarum NRRL Y-27907]